MPHQLTLDIKLRDDTTLANFHIGENRELLDFLQRFVTDNDERFVYLWGDESVGRSHLLQACCHAMKETSLESIYIPLKQKKSFTPEALQHLECIDLIAIDDVDAIVNASIWQEALFHLYNRVKEDPKSRLLISGPCPPSQLNLGLADLKSRLSWGMVMQVHGLTDDEKQSVLVQSAKERGMQLADGVAQFLIQRSPRNMRDLFDLLDLLDDASLRAQRRLTIPFVKDVLGI